VRLLGGRGASGRQGGLGHGIQMYGRDRAHRPG
jgi:hypothetical protein